jgi:hypothetical protein
MNRRFEPTIRSVTVPNWDEHGEKTVRLAEFTARLEKARSWYYDNQKWFEEHAGTEIERVWSQRYHDLEEVYRLIEHVKDIASDYAPKQMALADMQPELPDVQR